MQWSALRVHKHDASHGDFKSNDSDTFQKHTVCHEALHRCSPRDQKAVTSEGRGRQGTGSEVRCQRSQRCYKKHPAGPLRAQWQQKVRVRTHASVCSKEQRGRTLVGGPRGVCVCACARAGLGQQAGRQCPLGTLATTLHAGLVSCHQTAALSLLPSPPLPRLGAGAQADEATQTGPLCVGCP